MVNVRPYLWNTGIFLIETVQYRLVSNYTGIVAIGKKKKADDIDNLSMGGITRNFRYKKKEKNHLTGIMLETD